MKNSSDDVPLRESKYARKLRLRRKCFGKVESANLQTDPKIIVEATVVFRGCAYYILEEDSGSGVYLSMDKVRNTIFNFKIKMNTRIKCVLQENPAATRPRVLEILEIIRS